MVSSRPSDVIRLAIPSKGRIAQPTRDLVEKSGLHIIDGNDRQLIARTSDPHLEILFARPIDIPGYVENGAADLGITGKDMVSERRSHVVELLDLKIGIARMVVAVPEGRDISSVSDLTGARIATEFPTIASEYFHEHGIQVSLVPVSGACEATPHLGIADAIVDLTSSGTTLQTHHLKVLTEILKTTTVLVANHESMEKKRDKIDEITVALESVVRARGQCYIMMNVCRSAVEEIKRILPGLSGPTVMEVASVEDLVAVHAVVDEDRIYRLIRLLKQAGARDILVMPIDRMIR